MLPTSKIICADVIDGLRQLEPESVQCCVTSPPYWGLRDYGADGQIGLESTPDAFVAKMVEVFTEVKRVLRKDGTVWLNLGDSYNSNQARAGMAVGDGYRGSDTPTLNTEHQRRVHVSSLKPKDLCMMPFRVAMALQADGWWLRSVIPWLKRNPMPESTTDRPSSAIEYIFLLTKAARYYYDADAVRGKAEYGRRSAFRSHNYEQGRAKNNKPTVEGGTISGSDPSAGRNRRNSDWFFESWQGLLTTGDGPLAMVVNPQSYSEAHFATFPEKLVKPCILAGTSEGDVALDPFAGSGTTGLVALQHKRSFIGIELNPEYVKLAEDRIAKAESAVPSKELKQGQMGLFGAKE